MSITINKISVPSVARNGRIYNNGLSTSSSSGGIPQVQVDWNASTGVTAIMNKPVYDVKSYGAKGDGLTDDSSNIQKAIDACNIAGGGIVFFPKGNYKLSTGLVGYSNIEFIGSGREVTKLSTINFGDGETFGSGGSTTVMLYFIDVNNVVIRDMWFMGVSINGGSSKGVWFELTGGLGNTAHIMMSNVLITDMASNAALFVDTPILSTFTNVKTLRVAGHGIRMINGTSVTMNECYAITTTEAGFLFDTMTYCVFNSCASEVCGVSFDFVNCSAIVCNGCGVEGATNRNDKNDKYKYGEAGYGTFKTAYDGVSYRSTNSKVQLNSCYSRDPMLAHTQGYFDKINCREFTLYPMGCNIDYDGSIRQYTQGTNAVLATAINNSQTTFSLAAGTGANFPTTSFWIIVYPATFNSAFEAYASTDATYGGAAELMKVSLRSGDNLWVDSRGQGTFWNRFEALAFSAGAKVDHANQFFYAITFVDNLGQETRLSDYPWRGYRSFAQMIVKDIPVSTNTNVVARNIYRTKAGDEHFMFYKIHTINDNVTTSWVDNVLDTTLTTIAAHPEPSPHIFSTVAGSTSITVDTNRFAVGDIVKADYSDYLPYPFSRGASIKYKVLTVNGNIITLALADDTTNTPIVVSTTVSAPIYLSKFDMPGEDCGIENNFKTFFNTLPGGSYTLPIASSSVLGGVKIGSGISIDANGVISSNGGYTLPVATSSVLGGVKQGTNITIDTNGVISSTGGGGGTSLNGTGYVKMNGAEVTYDNSIFLTSITGALKSGSTTQNFSAFDLSVAEDEYLTGQLIQSHHNGKASHRYNWSESGYWGIGATNSNNIVKLGSTGEDGTFNNGSFVLEIPGAGNGVILASPNGTRYKLTVSNAGVLTVTAA